MLSILDNLKLISSIPRCICSNLSIISNHTARRSFCTNAYKEGLDALLIMSISGHSTIDSFLDYIKVTKEEFAERFAQTDYFKLMTSSAKPDLRIA